MGDLSGFLNGADDTTSCSSASTMHKHKQEKAFTKAREEDFVDPMFAELQFCDKFFSGKGCDKGRDCFFSHDRVMKAKA